MSIKIETTCAIALTAVFALASCEGGGATGSVHFTTYGEDYIEVEIPDSSSSPDGSISRALKLAEQGMYETKRGLLERLVNLPSTGEADLADHLIKTTDKLAAEAMAEAKTNGGASLSKNLASRQAAGAMLELIASAYRDAITVASGARRPSVHADQADVPSALAGRFTPTELAEIIDQLAEYERLLWRNVNPKTVWDNVAITCASAAPLRL